MDIKIKEIVIGKWGDFDCPEEAVLCLDSLLNRPSPIILEKYNISSKMHYLHFILPHVAKLFKINRKDLVKEWVSEFGIYDFWGYINE